MIDTICALMMLACFALALGAWAMLRRGERQRALLMLVAALVLALNVALWLVPVGGSQNPQATLIGAARG